MDGLILGIDGGTWDVVAPLMARGKLPNLAELAHEGRTGDLESTLPPLSGPAWASFMLGANPGAHPYFDFNKYDITDYEYDYGEAAFLNSSNLRGRTIWDSLSAAGHRVGVVDIPMTVPAWEIDGVMISGFPSPEVSTTPADLDLDAPLSDLVVPSLAGFSQSERREYCLELVESERAIATELLADHGIDVLGIDFMSSDIAQHYFWREHTVENDGSESAIVQVYRRIDAAIGRLVEQAGNCPVFVFSDHGAGPAPTRFFNINSWLLETGYLSRDLDGTGSDTINSKAIDFAETLAYRFPLKPPTEGIVLNVGGRQPNGQVAVDDYETVRDEIIDELATLEDEDGTTVVKHVARRNDIYASPHMEQAPDIVMVLNPIYKGAPKVTNIVFEDIPNPYPNHYTGIHRTDGLYIFPEETNVSGRYAIADLRRLIESTLGVSSRKTTESDDASVGDGVEQDVTEQLRSLGYTEP